MRKPAGYPEQRYNDRNDLRMVRIIKPAMRAVPGAVNILGAPFDGAVLGRRGAAGGPAGVRQAMSAFSNFNPELGVGLKKARVFDLGDIQLDSRDVRKSHASIRDEVAQCLESDSLLVLLGGDNSISLPSLNAFSDKFGNIGVVVIDSHYDLRGKIRGLPTSGSSYGLAAETVGGLDPGRIVEIGIHGFLNSEDYARKAEKLGISVHTASDVRRIGPGEVAKEAYRAASAKGSRVYLSVDLDAVDLAQVSGVSAPSAGGIDSRELFELLYLISRNPGVAAGDIVELAPSLDLTGRSQNVAAAALVYLTAGFFTRRSG